MTERDVVLTRIFNAPPELMFKLWTDPLHVAQWWGPHGFTNPVCEMDVRPGGALRIVMRAPDGTDYPMKGVFQEIVAPERLVFTNIAVDASGDHLIEGLTTVTFAAQGGSPSCCAGRRPSHRRIATARRRKGRLACCGGETSRDVSRAILP